MQRVSVALVVLGALWGFPPCVVAQAVTGVARTVTSPAPPTPPATSTSPAPPTPPATSVAPAATSDSNGVSLPGLGGPLAGEQSVAAALVLFAGQTCLEEARLERRVARWLERDKVNEAIQIEVIGTGRSDHVRFVLRRPGLQRTERDLVQIPGDCGDLHSAVALSIALAIDASLLGSLGEQSPESQPPSILVLPEPADGLSPEKGAWLVSAGAGLGFGYLPKLAPGSLLAVHYRPVQALEFRVQGSLLWLSDVAWPQLSGVSYDAMLSTASLFACAMVQPMDTVSAGACLKGGGGAFRSKGRGLVGPSVVSHAYWSVGAALEFRLRLAEIFGIRLTAEFDLSLVNRTLGVEEDPTPDEKRLPPVAAFFAVAPYFRFP